MALPVERPLEPMLAKVAEAIPEGEGWLYEPRWDGSRALVYVLGINDYEGVLRHVGLSAKRRTQLLELLKPQESSSSFGDGHASGGPSRWSRGRDMSWTAARPVLVCKGRFDRLVQGRFRHAATFERWRPDQRPGECTFARFEGSGGTPASRPLSQPPFWLERP